MIKPSCFATVKQVLDLVRGRGGPDPKNPFGAAARAMIPSRRPYAQMFLASELYYQNPEARRTVLEAMSGL